MSVSRVPKVMFHGQLLEGHWHQGGIQQKCDLDPKFCLVDVFAMQPCTSTKYGGQPSSCSMTSVRTVVCWSLWFADLDSTPGRHRRVDQWRQLLDDCEVAM